MRRLFGKKKDKVPPPTLEEASGNLEGQINGLKQKVDECTKELMQLREQYKKNKSVVTKNRLAMVLKRKKMYEQQLETIMAQSFGVEQALFMGQ